MGNLKKNCQLFDQNVVIKIIIQPWTNFSHVQFQQTFLVIFLRTQKKNVKCEQNNSPIYFPFSIEM